jgi:hypothetical protein
VHIWRTWYPDVERSEMLNCINLAAIVRKNSPRAEVKLAAQQHRTQHAMFVLQL